MVLELQFKQTYTAALISQMNSEKKVQEAKIEKQLAIDAVLPRLNSRLKVKQSSELFHHCWCIRERPMPKNKCSLKKQGYQNAEIIGQNNGSCIKLVLQVSPRQEADEMLLKLQSGKDVDL